MTIFHVLVLLLLSMLSVASASSFSAETVDDFNPKPLLQHLITSLEYSIVLNQFPNHFPSHIDKMFAPILSADFPMEIFDFLVADFGFEKMYIPSTFQSETFLITNCLIEFSSYYNGVQSLSSTDNIEMIFEQLLLIHSHLSTLTDRMTEKLFFGLPVFLLESAAGRTLEALVVKTGKGWLPGYFDSLPVSSPLLSEFYESSLTCCNVDDLEEQKEREGEDSSPFPTKHSLHYLTSNSSNQNVRFLSFLIAKINTCNSPTFLEDLLHEVYDKEEIASFGRLNGEDKETFAYLLGRVLELFAVFNLTSYKEAYVLLRNTILLIEDQTERMFLFGEFLRGFKFVNRISSNSTPGNKEFFIQACLEYLLLAKENPLFVFAEHPFEIARFARKWLYLTKDTMVSSPRLLHLISETKEYMVSIQSALVVARVLFIDAKTPLLPKRLLEYPIQPFTSYVSYYQQVQLPFYLSQKTFTVIDGDGLPIIFNDCPIDAIFSNVTPGELERKSLALSNYHISLETEGDLKIFIKTLCIILNNNLIHRGCSGLETDDWSTIFKDRDSKFFEVFYDSLKDIGYLFELFFLPVASTSEAKKQAIHEVIRKHFTTA